MLDRILVSDIQDEISMIQSELKNLNVEMVANTQADNSLLALKEGKEILSSPAMITSPLNSDKFNVKVSEVDQIKMDINSYDYLKVSDEKPSIDFLKKHTNESIDSFLPNLSCRTIKSELKNEHDSIPPMVCNEFDTNANHSTSYKPAIHSNTNNNNNNNSSSKKRTDQPLSRTIDLTISKGFTYRYIYTYIHIL